MENRDKTILRDLAKRVAELAALPIQEERRQVWYGVNELKPIRPAVYCSPEGSWEELMPEGTLRCEDSQARGIEWGLRSRIYAQEHFSSDNVCQADYCLGYVIRDDSRGPSFPRTIRSDSAERGSYIWETWIQTEDDLEKLEMPKLSYDKEATDKNLAFHKELFGDILDVRIEGGTLWNLGLVEDWGFLHGMEAMMWDMMDNPKFLHAAMQRILAIRMAGLDFLEQNGLLSLNNRNHYVASGPMGFTHELPQSDYTGQARLKDRWGYAEAQFFTDISPAMHEEFAVQYQAQIMDRFGFSSYGCCEPLHYKIPMLKRRMSNLRRVSISPWADKRISAQELGSSLIYSWKPNPAALATVTFHGDAVRADIRETIEICKEHNCVLEMSIKDTHTCNNEPWRFDEWTKIAMEECQRSVD